MARSKEFPNEIHGVIHKTPCSTRDEGDMVVMTIGNTEVRMPYAHSFRLSQMLRVSGKKAKRNAGDISHHWSVMGILDDANTG